MSLTAAAEGLTDRVTMVELDDAVAAVWQTILQDNGGGKWLANKIEGFEVTAESVKAVLAETDLTMRERAFQTILRNRVNRGGIMAPGAGLIKRGEAGRGLLSRWYPKTLKARILEIVKIRDRIRFIQGDGISILRQHAERPDVVFFIDPPYTASEKRAGSRLYVHSQVNHTELFDITATVAGDFLMTYDDANEVRSLARSRRFDIQTIAMKSTHHAKMNELLVGRNLDWCRSG